MYDACHLIYEGSRVKQFLHDMHSDKYNFTIAKQIVHNLCYLYTDNYTYTR